MLPITQSGVTATIPPRSSVDLACQPLRFNNSGLSQDAAVTGRIVDVLSNQSSDDDTMAAIFINAHNGGYQSTLNKLIRGIDDMHGTGTVVVNDHVREILAVQGIELAASEPGTVSIQCHIPVITNPDRVHAIEKSLESTLPPPLIDIIKSYDVELDLTERSRHKVIEIFRSGAPIQKGQLVEAIIEQGDLRYLDNMLYNIRRTDKTLRSAGIDLVNLIDHLIQFNNSNNCVLNSLIPLAVDVICRRNDSDHQLIARFLQHIFEHEYEFWLNSEIAARDQNESVESVLIRDGVKRILASKDIEVIQCKVRGKIALLGDYAIADGAEQRAASIDGALKSFPKVLTKIITQFEAPLKICRKNKAIMIEIFKSNDPVAKAELIAAASHQGQIKYLNSILDSMKGSKKLLDLSNVNLAGLDLTGIDLCLTDLTNANLQGTILRNATLTMSSLVNANLNGAIFVKASLTNANLTNASAIAADFTRASLTMANLDGAKLQLACFLKSDLSNATAKGACLGFTNLKSATYDPDFLMDAHWTVEEHGMSGRFA